MKDAPEQIEIDRCLCPECHVNVDEEAIQCPKCGARFPSMTDRQRLNTPLIYDLLRWFVLAVAIVIAMIAMVGLLIDYFADGP